MAAMAEMDAGVDAEGPLLALPSALTTTATHAAMAAASTSAGAAVGAPRGDDWGRSLRDAAMARQ